jgi:hypothetical protein
MPYGDLQQAIAKVILCPLTNSFILPTRIRLYPSGTLFFRVRNANGNKLPLDCAIRESDAWNPPQDKCTIQRLNKAGESLLYTTPGTPHISLKEAKTEPDNAAAIFVYRAQTDIKVNMIPPDITGLKLGEKERVNASLVINFLYDEFTRYVGNGNESLYKISEIIAKDYFDLPPREVQDAWCYPSVPSRGHFNVCFRPDIARDLLELRGAWAVVRTQPPEEFIIKAVALLSSGRFQYFGIGSPEQLASFPEITRSSS